VINWKSMNREFKHLSCRELAEQQVTGLDNESIRQLAVNYATLMNERMRRDSTRDHEQRASLESFRHRSDSLDDTKPWSPARAIDDLVNAASAAASQHVSTIAARMSIRLTSGFLSSKFSTDGTEIQWGNATSAQLCERRERLFKQFGSDAQMIARLDVAISALLHSGATSLRELAGRGVTTIGATVSPAALVEVPA
jgi:hypothetical protein